MKRKQSRNQPIVTEGGHKGGLCQTSPLETFCCRSYDMAWYGECPTQVKVNGTVVSLRLMSTAVNFRQAYLIYARANNGYNVFQLRDSDKRGSYFLLPIQKIRENWTERRYSLAHGYFDILIWMSRFIRFWKQPFLKASFGTFACLERWLALKTHLMQARVQCRLILTPCVVPFSFFPGLPLRIVDRV